MARSAERGRDPLARTWRLASVAPRPDVVVRAVVAAARVAFPGARVDLLVREPKRRWLTRAARPAGSLLTDVAAGAASAGARKPSPQPPPSAGARDLRGSAAEVVGDDELVRAGLAFRAVAPIRLGEARGLVSVARGDRPFDADDVARLEALASVAGPALAAEARLARAHRAVERARFVQHLTFHVNRSLDDDDVLRALARHLALRLDLERLDLVVVDAAGRIEKSLVLEASSGFRDVQSVPALDDAVALRVVAGREPVLQGDLAEVASASPGERAFLEAGLRCRVLLPLVARRRVVGVIVLATRRPGAMTGETLSLLRHVARPLAVALDNARLFEEAGRRTRQLTALYEVAKVLNSAADMGDVTERVLWILHDTFAFQHSAVLTLEHAEDADWLVLQASRGYSRRGDGSFRIRVGAAGVTSRAVRSGQLVYVPDVRRDPDYVQGVEEGRSEVAVPLVVGGRVIGVLDIESTKVAAFSAEDLDTVRLFSTQVAMALERARAFEEVRRQAMTDSLSGLLNQRSFNEKVAREISRSQRTGRPFVLCLLDVDEFKLINDSHGHVRGNQAIARLGEVLADRLRSIDAAARFGGDEFAMILSETTADNALGIVREVQGELARGIPVVGPLRVSVGVAEWRPHLKSVRDMVAAADEALYRAKRAGKNRACVAEVGAAGAGGDGAP